MLISRTGVIEKNGRWSIVCLRFEGTIKSEVVLSVEEYPNPLSGFV